jgi:tetratricopeptide (TPR) repeat protein
MSAKGINPFESDGILKTFSISSEINMFNLKYLVAVLALSVIGLAAISASAQTTQPIRGTVMVRDKDGKETPVSGATVESYRTDIGKGPGPSTTTGKKGEFSFVGFQLGALYALSVSGPGINPVVQPNVKAGMDSVTIVVSAGDGRKASEDEVRQFVANYKDISAGGNKAEKTKEQEEVEKKNAEITAKNEDIKNKNAVVQSSLKEGNAAYSAKDYDTAIAKYTQGINADPEFAGSAPIFLANRSLVLRDRARDTYNASVKSTDATEKVAAYAKVKKDLSDAADGLNKALAILKSAKAGENNDPNAQTRILNAGFEIYQMMVKTEQVDPEQIPTAKTFLDEYANAQSDAAKKSAAKLTVADLYRVAGDSDNAIAAYKDILTSDPKNVDALAGAGISLVNLGYIKNDKAILQEGANLLQEFVSVAPADHRYRQDAVGLIEALKEQNVAPQKSPSPRKKP